LNTPNPKIQITQYDLNEIKSSLGYPLITVLDFADQTDDYITDNVVSRVLRKYFTFFPIQLDTNTGINGSFEIDYPNDNVYRMFKHFFNYKTLNYETFSPFLLQAMTIHKGPYFRGFEHDHVREAITRLSTEESLMDYSRALRINDYPDLQKVKGFTNISGDITIIWAQKSNIFNDIPYNFKDDAIKLAKAYLLQDITRLRDQLKVSTKIEIDTATMKADGDRWEESVIRKWETRARAVIVK
jgi:hypothetical protein